MILGSVQIVYYYLGKLTHWGLGGAAVPCTLHSASDGLALADRLWMETLGGLNAKPGGSSVTDEPLEEKDVLFSPDL